jgi:hypothetical protein
MTHGCPWLTVHGDRPIDLVQPVENEFPRFLPVLVLRQLEPGVHLAEFPIEVDVLIGGVTPESG